MERKQNAEHIAEESIELQELTYIKIVENENNLESEQSQALLKSPNPSKINIEIIRKIFKMGNFRLAFSMFDENKDGLIDIKELKTMLNQLGSRVPNNVAQKLLLISDTDNDGYLNYQEFVKMVKQSQSSNGLFRKYANSYIRALIKTDNDHTLTRSASGNKSQRGRYEELLSCWPPPVAMIIISLIQVIFFIVDDLKFDTTSGKGPMATMFIYNPHRRYEVWRYLTLMFVHVGYPHLCINVYIQIFLGIPLEMVHGGWRIVIIYSAGIIAGSLTISIVDPNLYLAGSGAGVYSLVTAHIASVIINWKQMKFAELHLATFLVFIVIDFGLAFYNRFYSKVKVNISYEAHFAGTVAGLFVGIFVLRKIEKYGCKTRLSLCLSLLLVIFFLLMIIAIIFNIVNPSYFPP